MLSIMPAHIKYYPCSLNKYINIWGGKTFLRGGPRLMLRMEVKKMDENSFCVMLPSIAGTHTFLGSTVKYNQLLVPGAPPGGGCGDIGPQNLVQAF